nr:methyl-accepting chemotaxis protein [uncultured Anaeromusa sp.]
MQSIRSKLTIMMVVTVVISLCILGAANYWNAQKVILQDAEENLTSVAQINSERMGAWLGKRTSEIEVLTRTPVMQTGDLNQIMPYLKEEAKLNPVYARFLVADLQGNTRYSNDTNANLADREYFQQAKAGKFVIADPVIAKVDGKMVVVVAGPIKKNGQVIGVLGGTITVDELINVVNEVKVGQSGYAYVTQKNGLIIMHPEKERVMKENIHADAEKDAALKPLVAVTEGGKNLARYVAQGAEKYIVYNPIGGTSWGLSVTVPVQEITGKMNSMMWTSLLVVLVVLVAAGVVASLLAKGFARPIQELNGLACRLSQGNLQNVERRIHSQDEIGQLEAAFQTMAESLRALVQQVAQSVQRVSSASEALTAGSGQAAQASDHVATSILQMAQETDKQATSIVEATRIIGEITKATEGTAQSGQNVLEIVRETADATNHGRTSIEQAVGEMENLAKKSVAVEEAISELSRGSRQIGEIVELIANIAGQTNLLALNAAIEAARAGEQGRGFAVVADEVRKLAEQSNQAAQQIAALIGDNEAKMNQAVEATKASVAGIHSGVEIVVATGTTFQEISDSVFKLGEHVQEMATAVGKIAQDNGRVSGAISQIERMSQKNAGEAQSISAATEEQAASMEEIAAASHTLGGMADELKETVSKFKL